MPATLHCTLPDGTTASRTTDHDYRFVVVGRGNCLRSDLNLWTALHWSHDEAHAQDAAHSARTLVVGVTPRSASLLRRMRPAQREVAQASARAFFGPHYGEALWTEVQVVPVAR